MKLWLVLAVLSVSPASSDAHPNTALLCHKLAQATQLSASVLPNGLYSERYDTNGDGVLDLETLSAVTSVEVKGSMDNVEVKHRPYPIFYIEDTDYDHEPDRIMVDKGEGGQCADIVLYEDLHQLREHSNAGKEGRL